MTFENKILKHQIIISQNDKNFIKIAFLSIKRIKLYFVENWFERHFSFQSFFTERNE